MNLLDLMVKVGIDDQASSKIGGIAGGIKSSLANAAKAGAALVASVSAAAVGATTAIAGAIDDVAAYGDNIDKMSQKMGLSAQAYQEWDAVMQHSGTSMETMKAGMKTLANAVENGNEAFQRIGLTQEQIASMSQEELFAATIEGLQNIDNETERTYLAGQLLGRGATELGALLNTSAEDTQAMRDRVHELGGVMSDEAVKSSAAFKDSLQDLRAAINGIKNNALATLLPSMTTVMNGLQELMLGNIEQGQEMVERGVNEVISIITEKGPEFLDRVASIIGSVATAMLNNSPKVIGALVGMLSGLISKVRENIPQMLAAAGQLIMAVLTAIAQNAPQILADLLALLVDMVGYVITHVPDMLAAAAEMLGTFLEALGQVDIVQAIGGWLQGAVDKVNEFFTDMFNAGAHIIEGLIEGIKSAIGGVVDAVGGAMAAAGEYLPESPAKKGRFSGRGWTLYSGRSIMDALAQGIEDEAGTAEKAMEAAMGLVGDADSATIGLNANMASNGILGPQSANSVAGMLLAEVQSLHRDMANMKLYIDSRVAGGVLAPEMNRQLGIMEVANAR